MGILDDLSGFGDVIEDVFRNLGYENVRQAEKRLTRVATFDFDGPKRGIVIATGRFTSRAQEYAERLRQNDDSHPIELISGEDLREIADEIDLDLYNGRIEIRCEEML